jgi:ribosomal protein S27AE
MTNPLETRKEKKIVEVSRTCEKCGLGKMVANKEGMYYCTNPPLYPHFCTSCGEKENFRNKQYPYYEYVDSIAE